MKRIKLQEMNIRREMYILAVVCSIYFSYLVYHAYPIGGRISLIIALLLSGISIYLVKLFYKYIKLTEISRKVLCTLGILTIILSSIILFTNFDFFTKKFTKNKITIEVLDEKNENSKSNQVHIKGIVQANTLKQLEQIKTSKGWEYKNGEISTIGKNANAFKITFEKGNHHKIVFKTNQESGKIKITDGKYQEIIDLYSYKTGMKDYVIKGNRYIDFLFVIRLICSSCMIIFVTFVLILSSYFLYKENQSIILPILLMILALRGFYYSNLQAYTIYTDSASYINYNFEDFIHLKFPGRTPVYPTIISICKLLFGLKLYLNFVVLLQILISFVAVIYFYKTLKLLIKNRIIVALITLVYGITPAICGYDNCILTESLALSGYSFFIYHVIKYIKEAKIENGLLAVVISLIFTFLRPTCLILTVILFAFWIARFLFDRKYIRNDLCCFACSVVSIILIAIYSIIFYQTHQIYSISDPTIRQDLFICIDQGFYKASNDRNFIDDIEKKLAEPTRLTNNLKIWEIEEMIQEKYGNERVQELTAYCKKQMKQDYIRYWTQLIKTSLSTYYNGYSHLIMNYNNFLLDIQLFISKIANFSYVYIMILVELGVMIYKWIKEKKVPWIHAGLFAFSFAIMLSTFLGTNAEYMRTSIGVVPFFYLSIALFMNYICDTKIKERIKI